MGKNLIYNLEKMFIIFIIMLMVGTVQVSGAEGDKSGKCGDNVTWNYDAQSKTLTISGTGDTYDYKPSGGSEYSPWVQGKFHKEIQNIIVGSGITSLGTNFFSGCNVRNIIIPESVNSIGIAAFSTCEQMETIQLPIKVSMGAEVFQGCLALKQITGAGAIDGVLYADTIVGYSLEYYPPLKGGDTFEVPDGVVAIGAFAFDQPKYLKKIVFPQGLSGIYNFAINKPLQPMDIIFRGSISKLSHISDVGIHRLSTGTPITLTVRSEADKTALLNKLSETFTINIANVPARGLTLKNGSSQETAVVEPGESYTPTVKLAPYDTTDQVTWSYESSDSVKSFDSYTGTIQCNDNGRAMLTGRTGSGLTVTSEVYFYLPCDRESLKIEYKDYQGSMSFDAQDMAGSLLRIPLSGMVNDFKTNYYSAMHMSREPVHGGAGCSYAAQRMFLESSNPEIVQINSDTGKITPRAVGTATIIAKADDGPNGFITRSFTVEVVERNIQDCQIYNAKGDAYDVEKSWIMMGDKSELTIKDGGSVLTQGIDYQVSYENETSDSVCFRIIGLGRYAGERLAYCQISKTPAYNGGGTQDSNTPGYNGETVENTVPKPAIMGVKESYIKNYKDKPFTLKAKGKGKLTYSTSNKKVAVVGKTNGKVTLKEIGSATIAIKSSDAVLKVKIQVVPKKPSIIKASASGRKALRLNWKKDSKVTGYQIQISDNSKFKGIKTYTVKKNKTTSYAVKKLKAKKKYYIQIRSYKTVSGWEYYSSWSSTKTVKLK